MDDREIFELPVPLTAFTLVCHQLNTLTGYDLRWVRKHGVWQLRPVKLIN